MSKTPLKDIVGSKSSELSGRKIVLCVTGSVAAYESVEVARELMRYGADVTAVMTEAAKKIVHPNLLEWATGNAVVTELTGRAEHIELAGNWEGRADLILIAPSTANTIGKIAAGIDDSAVTTVASVAFGNNIPVIIAPGMHEPMYTNPVVKEAMKKLASLGIEFVEPRLEEGKAKMAEAKEIVDAVVRRLGPKDMAGLKVLVTSGPTLEYLDPVRVITNRSSGKMGVALAEEAYSRGADVTLVSGLGSAKSTASIRNLDVDTTEELYQTVAEELKKTNYDIVMSAGAPADFRPEKPYRSKISTRSLDRLQLSLIPTPKVVEQIKKVSPETLLVAFKAEHGVNRKRLLQRASQLMKEADADVVVANDVSKEGAGFESDTNEVYVLEKSGRLTHIPLMAKREVARRIMNTVSKLAVKKK